VCKQSNIESKILWTTCRKVPERLKCYDEHRQAQTLRNRSREAHSTPTRTEDGHAPQTEEHTRLSAETGTSYDCNVALQSIPCVLRWWWRCYLARRVGLNPVATKSWLQAGQRRTLPRTAKHLHAYDESLTLIPLHLEPRSPCKSFVQSHVSHLTARAPRTGPRFEMLPPSMSVALLWEVGAPVQVLAKPGQQLSIDGATEGVQVLRRGQRRELERPRAHDERESMSRARELRSHGSPKPKT